MDPQLAIIIEQGPGLGRTMALPAEGTVAIGRDASSGLSLGDPAASPHHAELTHRGDRVWLRDLGTVTGTVVGAQRLVGPIELQAGRRLRHW